MMNLADLTSSAIYESIIFSPVKKRLMQALVNECATAASALRD
jgi:hypothetical protein